MNLFRQSQFLSYFQVTKVAKYVCMFIKIFQNRLVKTNKNHCLCYAPETFSFDARINDIILVDIFPHCALLSINPPPLPDFKTKL